MIDLMFVLAHNLTDLDVFDFNFETNMKAQIENSVAVRWRGKFSKLDKASWHLMDIGIGGSLLCLVTLAYAIFFL